MTTQEFSNTFDTLLNSYNTQSQFGEQASKREIVLDEYEKSVLLTQAQDIVVKSYFDGTLNQQGQGFDDSNRRQMDFSSLIKIAELDPLDPNETEIQTFDDRGIVYQLPRKVVDGVEVEGTTDVLFILNEKLTQVCTKGGKEQWRKDFVIVPISYKEYDREMSKPYAQPLKKQAWRLFQNQATGFDINSELIPRFNVKEEASSGTVPTYKSFVYKIRYVKRPQPIVLEDLPNNLEIDGVTTESECELNPIIHMDILNKAVELAIATRGGGGSSRPTTEVINK
jgi:hypothetical protein